jgi:hypothetical protein
VPAAVPSLFQSSFPVSGWDAEKKSVPPPAVSHQGREDSCPGTMSRTSTVPAAVPSLRHSSRPVPAWTAEKNSVPLTSTRLAGPEEPATKSAPGLDVPDEHGARLGPVALPQLAARVGVERCEEERAVDAGHGHFDGPEEVKGADPGIDVLDQHGSGGRPVALPQLVAGLGVEGREEERAVHVGETEGPGRAGPGVDVLDRPRGRPVALPESSTPALGDTAVKNNVPPTAMRLKGSVLKDPRWATTTVPAAVPSLLQSVNVESTLLTKNSVLPMAVK